MKQVLVVDDSPMIRKIARRILEGMRLRTSEAADGRETLAACSFQMPDALFVDGNMPVLDGFEFLKELRACLEAKNRKSFSARASTTSLRLLAR